MLRKVSTDFAVGGVQNDKRKMHEVQERSRNQRRQGNHNEEWHEGNERFVRRMQHKGFQNSWKS